jgi:hypothetical protein
MIRRLLPFLVLLVVAWLAGCSGGNGTAGPSATIRSTGDHAASFPISPGDVHGPPAGQPMPDCFACHADLSSGTRQLPSSMKVFTCTGCHVTTVGGFDHADASGVRSSHLGVADFDAKVASLTLDGACYSCHRSGAGGAPADHQQRFPLPHPGASGGTSQAACADCHTDRAHPQDVTTLGCAACHDKRPGFSTKHGTLAAYSDTSAACVRCHADGMSRRLAQHAFKIDPALSPKPKHDASVAATGDCFACHPIKGIAANASSGAPARPWAQDFSVSDCGACHVPVALTVPGSHRHDLQADIAALHVATNHSASIAAYDAEVAAKGGWPGACFSCHGDGTSLSLPSNHVSQLFPLPHPGATGGTSQAACTDCHTDPLARSDVTKLGCLACHGQRPGFATAHAKVATASAAPAGPAACVQCHPMGEHLAIATHTPFLLAATATVATVRHLSTALAGGDCFKCHPTKGTPAVASPAMPAKAYAQAFKTTSCVTCHLVVGHATGTTASHDVQAELATLHLANGGVSTVADFNSAVTTAGTLSAACLKCHADGTGNAAPADHGKWFPIDTASAHKGMGCNQCHTNPANRLDLTAFACASCHARDTSPTLTAGHTVSGYAITSYQTATTAGGTRATVQVDMTKSQSCLRCHADAQVNTVAGHPGGSSGFGTGRHLPAGCLTCHSRLRTDKTYGANFSEAKGAAGPPPSGCYVCHASGTGD